MSDTDDAFGAALRRAWKDIAPRIIRRDGLRLGTSAEAGRLCVNLTRSPDGVQSGSYRRMREWGNAPGPAIDPATVSRDEPYGAPYRHPRTGQVLYDLDAVDRWNQAGRKHPGKWWVDVTQMTPTRLDIARAIGRGAVTHQTEPVSVHGRKTRTVLLVDGERPATPRIVTRVVNDMARARLVSLDGPGNRVTFTAAGRELLARWEEEAAADPTFGDPVPARAG